MNKVKLMVEMPESKYKTIMRKNPLTNKEASDAITAILNATPLTESDDCVSRKAVIDAIEKEEYKWDALDAMKALLPALPNREQGEWIKGFDFGLYRCSKCRQMIYSETEEDRNKFHKFCGKCGAKMVEPQESEDRSNEQNSIED